MEAGAVAVYLGLVVKRARHIVNLLVLLASLVGTSGCWQMKYLGQAGAGQFKLLQSRRRVVDVLSDPNVSAELKQKLQLAIEARDFGREVLGLRGGDAYTRFIDLGGKPVAYNLSAAYKDRLALKWWAFPIVGRVPYLGYFHKEDAEAEAKKLEAAGLDVHMRPVAGFSTLGYFAEPIFSSMLEGPPYRIVEVVLHEMLHSTIYVPGQSAFNESFATLVGVEGAAQFFRQRGDSDAAARLIAEAERADERERLFSDVLASLQAELKQIYAAEDLSLEQKLDRREVAYIRAQAEYMRLLPPAPGEGLPSFARKKLNNAVVLSYGIYHSNLPRLRELLGRLEGDLPAMIQLTKQALERDLDPDTYMERKLRKKERPID